MNLWWNRWNVESELLSLDYCFVYLIYFGFLSFFLLCFHLFKNYSTLLFFFLKGLSLVREDILEPTEVWIIDEYALECCGIISTIISLFIEDIEDPMEVWMIGGNDWKYGNLFTMRRLRDCCSLGLLQVPTCYLFWFDRDLL